MPSSSTVSPKSNTSRNGVTLGSLRTLDQVPAAFDHFASGTLGKLGITVA